MRFVIIGIFISTICVYSDSNKTSTSTHDLNATTDSNSSNIIINIKKQLQKEKKYKHEQKFYMGSDYNLSEHKIDKKSLNKIKAIEPDYEFDITDVYNDQPE